MQENKNTNSKQSSGDNTPNNSQSKLLGITIIILIIIVVLLLGIIIAGGIYWYLHNKNINNTLKAKNETIKTTLEEKNKNYLNRDNSNTNKKTDTAKKENKENQIKEVIYENKEYGFRLKLTPSWAHYKVKEVFQGGDFNVADIDFYLPSKEFIGKTDIPGYVKIFSISVYVTESWNETERDHGNDVNYGELIGSNDFYTFVYSHINGEAVPDISSEAIKDMEVIAKNIEVFDPQSIAHDEASLSKNTNKNIEYDEIYSNYFKFDKTFAKNSTEYWNCKFNYQLNYPSSWSNNGMTKMSEKVALYGNNVTTIIKAVDAKGLTTKEFFVREYKKEFPKATAEPNGDRIFMSETNTLTYYLAFAAPYEWRLYWKVANSDIGIVMTTKGNGFMKEWDNITKMFGTLRVNTITRPECVK